MNDDAIRQFEQDSVACPQCAGVGGAVSAVTVAHHAQPSALEQLAAVEGWRICRTQACLTVYFGAGQQIDIGAMRSVPFHKSDDPNRLVCFCFDHSVAALYADAAANPTSTIKAAITAACGRGLDDCEIKNPQGRCCLGNIALVLGAAKAAPV